LTDINEPENILTLSIKPGRNGIYTIREYYH